MECEQTVTNSVVTHGLCAMTAMHCLLRLTPTMINHLTSNNVQCHITFHQSNTDCGSCVATLTEQLKTLDEAFKLSAEQLVSHATVSYRILSWGEKHGGSRMTVAHESTVIHV